MTWDFLGAHVENYFLLLGLLPAIKLAGKKILIEQNINIQTVSALYSSTYTHNLFDEDCKLYKGPYNTMYTSVQ